MFSRFPGKKGPAPKQESKKNRVKKPVREIRMSPRGRGREKVKQDHKEDTEEEEEKEEEEVGLKDKKEVLPHCLMKRDRNIQENKAMVQFEFLVFQHIVVEFDQIL